MSQSTIISLTVYHKSVCGLNFALLDSYTYVYIQQPRKRFGYQVFAGERLREHSEEGGQITELIKDIPSMWKALTDAEREVCK